MPAPIFNNLTDATLYLKQDNFRFPSQWEKFRGVDVLHILTLDAECTKRYNALRKTALGVGLKHNSISLLKSSGLKAASLLHSGLTGNVPGFLKNMFLFQKSVIDGNPDEPGIEEKIATESADLATLIEFEQAFRRRLPWIPILTSFKLEKGQWYRMLEADVDDVRHFMYRR